MSYAAGQMSISGIAAQEPPGQCRKLNAYQPRVGDFQSRVVKSPDQMADPQIRLDIDRVILFERDVDRAQGTGNNGDTASFERLRR